MDKKDDELQKALDDIFGDSITTNKTNNEKIIGSEEELKEPLDIEEITVDKNTYETKEQKINNEEFEKTLLLPINEEKENGLVMEQNTEEKEKKDVEETVLDSLAEDKNNESEEIVSEPSNEESSISINKFIIYFLIGILIGFVVIYLLLNSGNKKTMVSNCSFSVEDANYKINEEYKITYNKNNINFVEGSYLFKAKTEEYKNQVEFIKKDKIPVIINSNGMSGFTYMYETTSDSFKVNLYLDYEKFNKEKIKEIDQEITPISFFEIKTEKNYDNLIKTLENKGFNCTKSK